MNQIYFHSEETPFKLSNQQVYVDWIFALIKHHQFACGELNLIFCSDEYLLEINRKHLSHDYYTDIITFNYVQKDVLSGDVFISVDRVRENASLFSVSFADELARVMAHGVLHLVGYNDKNEKEQREMRKQEDKAIDMLNGLKINEL